VNAVFVIKRIIDGELTETGYAKGVERIKDFFNIRNIAYDRVKMALLEGNPEAPWIFNISDTEYFIVMPSSNNFKKDN